MEKKLQKFGIIWDNGIKYFVKSMYVYLRFLGRVNISGHWRP